MKIPFSWLKSLVNIPDTAEVFSKKITDIGNAVEGIEYEGAEITNVVVGRIVSLEKHPDADKLFVTKTDIGKEILQIITGADNLKVGDYIPVALHGATLANGLKIKKSKMRGLESNGMLVSIEEFGYTKADFPDAPDNGIYVFNKPYELGIDVKPILGLSDEIIDFDILSNRPDTNSVIGMSREIAAMYGEKFLPPDIHVKSENNTKNPISATLPDKQACRVTVEIKDPDICKRYIARVVTDIKIEPSPKWMRDRLISSGVKPINNIVDITNYVMLEYGQPLHAFDINTVTDNKIIVRRAYKNEKLQTLDNTCFDLPETALVIADAKRAIGLAGIMGGKDSMITDNTTTVLFESANFDAKSIRQTARGLGLNTDSSARYIKGQDPNICITSINRAMELVELLNCGNVIKEIVDIYPSPVENYTVAFEPENIYALLGISEADIYNILNNLDIKTENNIAYIPSYRADITCEADIAEEVARFFGLNNIQSVYHQIIYPAQPKSPMRIFEDKIKQTITALGYYEALTYSFESPKIYEKLEYDYTNAVRILNPLNEDLSIMRFLPIGGMLENMARNKGNARLFEIVTTYHFNEKPIEIKHLVLAAYDTDFLSFKGDIEHIITNLRLEYTRCEESYMHPGMSADITATYHKKSPKTNLGFFGEVHPRICKNFEIEKVYIAVIQIEELFNISKHYKTIFKAPSIYPAMYRDIAFLVQEDITAAQIEEAIRERGGQLLDEVRLFDIYTGSQIQEGYKSMAYALSFKSHDKSLTENDIKKPLEIILDNLSKKYGAIMRDK